MHLKKLDNRGVAAAKIIVALTSFFVLTIIFITMDPVISGDLYDSMSAMAPDRTANLDRYVLGWHMWVPLFMAAIFLYIITAAWNSDSPSRVRRV